MSALHPRRAELRESSPPPTQRLVRIARLGHPLPSSSSARAAPSPRRA